MGVEPGDIYVKKFFKADPVSHVIQTGQLVTGTRHSNYVHAGIAVNSTEMAESQGSGVVINNINDNLEHGYEYKVFRYTGDQATIDLAVDFALQQAERNPRYSIAKAARSLFGKRKAENPEKQAMLGKETYYCSELVVDCYGRADPSLFDGEKSRNWNPSKLYTYLKENPHHWKNLGAAYQIY